MRALQSQLGMLNVGDEGSAEPPPKVLEDLTVEGVVKHIRKLQASGNSECCNIKMCKIK